MSTDELLADQAVVFQDFPTETVSIADLGFSGEALILQWSDGNVVEFGGICGEGKSGRLAIERGTMATPPTEGMQIVIPNGKKAGTYRIGTVDHSDEGDSWRFVVQGLP